MTTVNLTFIASQTLASSTSSVTFSSIPQTYTDLKLVCSMRNTASNAGFGVRVGNGSVDTGANYTWKNINGNGSAAGTISQSVAGGYNTYAFGNTVPSFAAANTFNNAEIYFSNYTSSGTKSFFIDSAGEDNASSAYVSLCGALWSGTSAINTISVFSDPGSTASNLAQYSTFYLYGIKNS